MKPLTIRHVGIHVRSIEEEMEFLSLLGAQITSMGTLGSRGRIAFVSLDGVYHHNLALFEDGEPLPSGDSQRENMGLDHIAMETESREAVDEWVEKLTANGIKVSGPQIQGPEDGLMEEGSRSYSAAFHDPNGVCFEIFAEPFTVAEYREVEQQRAKLNAST